MLNSNFDLRTFLTESKASTEQIQEVTLTEATVMEYIRERMSSMNNEVRSCMREYLERCNEIDMEHEDAHAQLMNALEDFYNKLKAHFEEDEADMEEPLATSTDSPQIPVEEDQDFTKTPDEREEDEKERFDSYYTGEEDNDDSFGSDKDAVDEGLLDRLKRKPAQSQPAPAKVLSADEIQAMIDQEAKTNTVGDILNAATVLGTIDLRNATPEQVKMFVSIARDSDHEHDTITGDTYMNYLESLPNYKGVAEVKVNEGDDYEPRTQEDLVYQYLRDAWQLGAMKGKDVNPDEELSTMADSLLANLPDYDSAEKVEKPKEKSAFEKRLEKLAAAEKERRANLKEDAPLSEVEKHYGEKYPKDKFAKLKDRKVVYDLKSYTVVDADEDIITLKGADGKTKVVNLNQFKKAGAIPENKQA